MKTRLIVLSLLALACINVANAQENSKQSTFSGKKHEIRLSVSDGLTQTTVGVLGIGLADAITGTKRMDERSSIGYGLGYRYAFDKFRVGADFGFLQNSSKVKYSGDKVPSIKEKELNFMILPTAEYIYFRKGIVELYGSASAGISLKRNSEKGLTESGKKTAHSADLSTVFAYQINPIGFRIGNEHIGGFVEAGLGHKGFFTTGISVKF